MGYRWNMGFVSHLPWRDREEEKMVMFFGIGGIGNGDFIWMGEYVTWFYNIPMTVNIYIVELSDYSYKEECLLCRSHA